MATLATICERVFKMKKKFCWHKLVPIITSTHYLQKIRGNIETLAILIGHFSNNVHRVLYTLNIYTLMNEKESDN